jgi:hypothetical protein
VFPNPGQSHISIVSPFSNHENLEIRIVDGMGATVLVKNDVSRTELLNVDFLPAGMYIIFISVPGNKKLYYKWIKS